MAMYDVSWRVVYITRHHSFEHWTRLTTRSMSYSIRTPGVAVSSLMLPR